MAILVDLERVSVRTADRILFNDLSLTVSDGDRLGVVGTNGTGKSTLLRVMAGELTPDGGNVRRGQGSQIGYLGQEPDLPPGIVQDVVGEGWEAQAVLERLGMGGAKDVDVKSLSGGQAKRVALARVLSQPCDLLILDEPTNHLDLAAVTWLEQHLAKFRGGLVLVSHDRHLLDRVTTRMLELDRGHRHIHEGGYNSYLIARVDREEAAATADSVRQNLARRELAWLRRGAKARTRKSKSHITRATALIEERPEAAARTSELSMQIGTPRLGNVVIECSKVTFSYSPDQKPIFSNVDLMLSPTERLGIVGANGTGKSTFLDLLSGRKKPNSGEVVVGSTVVLSYYDQKGAKLDPKARLQDLVAGPHGKPGSLEDVALMKRFWFTGDLPFAPVGTLSGGERRRLQLLLALAKRPNVLLLDEPTNDLDLDTLRILEEFFEDWGGALVVVSHDRTFLERTTERLIGFDESGELVPIAGGVDGWIASHNQSSTPTVETATKAPRTAPVAKTEKPTSVSKGRSSSSISKDLRDAEKEVARLQRLRDRLTEEIVSTTDRVELARIGSALTEAQTNLDETENRWLSLAEEAEQRR